jgi:4,5-dihydroxyphthalate decarboxylase
MKKIIISMALTHCDHIADLVNGSVRVEGVKVNHMRLPLHDIFQRATGFADFDVAEMSTAKYASMRSQSDNRYIALPVFLSRVCRHSAIYVRTDRIRSKVDFIGKRVGVPEWAQTAAVYGRGILSDELGVPIKDVEWVQAGLEAPGRLEKVELKLPAGVRLTSVSDFSLADLLDNGRIDALIAADPPTCFGRNSHVARFFPNFEAVEREYVSRTRIFPIMHTVVVRSELLLEHPWLAGNLFNAFEEAKEKSLARLRHEGVTSAPLPWIAQAVARAKETLGEDFWPYGVEANRPTLSAFLRWAFEQGVCHRLLTPEELFAPQTRSAVKV